LKHVEDSNKHIIEEIVRQVGNLPELYENARSEKYKIFALRFAVKQFTISNRTLHNSNKTIGSTLCVVIVCFPTNRFPQVMTEKNE